VSASVVRVRHNASAALITVFTVSAASAVSVIRTALTVGGSLATHGSGGSGDARLPADQLFQLPRSVFRRRFMSRQPSPGLISRAITGALLRISGASTTSRPP